MLLLAIGLALAPILTKSGTLNLPNEPVEVDEPLIELSVISNCFLSFTPKIISVLAVPVPNTKPLAESWPKISVYPPSAVPYLDIVLAVLWLTNQLFPSSLVSWILEPAPVEVVILLLPLKFIPVLSISSMLPLPIANFISPVSGLKILKLLLLS